MRAHWILGGTGIAAIWVAAVLVGHSAEVKGDTTPATPTSSPEPGYHEPNTPYPLGPHPILYNELSASDKAAVDTMQETVETTQPASSYQAWAAATAWTGQAADAESAARSLGLAGTGQDGVVP